MKNFLNRLFNAGFKSKKVSDSDIEFTPVSMSTGTKERVSIGSRMTGQKALEQKLVHMYEYTNLFLDSIKNRGGVVFNITMSKNHYLIKGVNTIVPFIVLNKLGVRSSSGREIEYTYTNADEIIICMNSIHTLAKNQAKDPTDFLYEVLEFIKDNVEAGTEPMWYGHTMKNQYI